MTSFIHSTINHYLFEIIEKMKKSFSRKQKFQKIQNGMSFEIGA